MTSSFLSRSFHVLMLNSRTSFTFSSMTIRQGTCLHHGTSASITDYQLFGFWLGRLSKIKKINKWITVDSTRSQCGTDKSNSSKCVTFHLQSPRCAMTQASVKSRVLKHLPHSEVGSRLFSRDLKIKASMDSRCPQKALTPPPRQGSINSDSSDSEHVQDQNSGTSREDHLFTQRLGQDVPHAPESTQELFGHANHRVCLSIHQDVSQRRQHNKSSMSFRWRFSSFRTWTSIKEGIRRPKEGIRRTKEGIWTTKERINHVIIDNDYQQVRVRCLHRYCLTSSRPLSRVDQHFALISPKWVDSSLKEIMGNTQLCLTEKMLNLLRKYHCHLKSVLFNGSEFKSTGFFRELEWSQSCTLEDVTISPTQGSHHSWKLTKVSSSTKVIHRLHQRQPSWSRMRRSWSSDSTHFSICEQWFGHNQNHTLKQIDNLSADQASASEHQQLPLVNVDHSAHHWGPNYCQSWWEHFGLIAVEAQMWCRGSHLASRERVKVHHLMCLIGSSQKRRQLQRKVRVIIGLH